MLDQEDGHALAAHALDQHHHLPRLFGVHAGEGFVEQYQLGLGRQRHRDAQSPLVAVRQVDRLVVAAFTQSHEFENFYGRAPPTPVRHDDWYPATR